MVKSFPDSSETLSSLPYAPALHLLVCGTLEARAACWSPVANSFHLGHPHLPTDKSSFSCSAISTIHFPELRLNTSSSLAPCLVVGSLLLVFVDFPELTQKFDRTFSNLLLLILISSPPKWQPHSLDRRPRCVDVPSSLHPRITNWQYSLWKVCLNLVSFFLHCFTLAL